MQLKQSADAARASVQLQDMERQLFIAEQKAADFEARLDDEQGKYRAKCEELYSVQFSSSKGSASGLLSTSSCPSVCVYRRCRHVPKELAPFLPACELTFPLPVIQVSLFGCKVSTHCLGKWPNSFQCRCFVFFCAGTLLDTLASPRRCYVL